jgi:hypothetical protein
LKFTAFRQLHQACYDSSVPTSKQILLTGLLLSLLVGPMLTGGSADGAERNERDQSSVRSADTLTRSYALTSFHYQRTARDSAKENRLRHPVVPAGLTGRSSYQPDQVLRGRSLAERGQFLYTSACCARPVNRGPPLSV